MTDVSWHPYIVEDHEFRSLQFAEWDIQSRMRKSAPDELVLSYTQAMVAFMLFVEAPQDVLIAGLGGGSLSKFCYRYLPDARITTVEISAEVIALREQFCIPADNDRFRVVHADMAAWLQGQRQIADVILLDGYDEEGVPVAISELAFYALCRDALSDRGMLVANVNLGVIESSADTRRALAELLGEAVSIRSAAGHNDVVLAFRAVTFPPVPELKARAKALRERTGVDFPLLLDKVRSAAALLPVME